MAFMRPNDKGERKEFTIGGKRYVRDGSRLRPIDQMEALGGNFEDPSLMDVNGSPVAGSLGYAQGMHQLKREQDNAYRDREWNSAAGQLGLTGNWRQLRKQMLGNARSKGIDDAELEYLWNAGPRVWQKLGYLGDTPAPAPTPGPALPPTPITPTNIVNTNRPPRTTRPPQPAPQGPADTTPINANWSRLGVQPSVISLNPTQPSAAYTNKPKRPPVGGIQTGYTPQPKRTTAQLGF